MKYSAKDFIPLGDSIIVKPIKVTEKSGFIRPQNEEDKSELGEVVSLPKLLLNQDLKVGDIVLFNKYSSTAMDMGEELIVRLEDVVGILRKNKNENK